MKLKHGTTALLVAGSLTAAPVFAQVDIREYPGNEWEEVDRNAPISSNLPGQNLAGVGIEETSDTPQTAAADQQRLRELERRIAQLEEDLERQQSRYEDQLDEQRAALEQERAELEREREELQARMEAEQQAPQGEMAAGGGQRIEWGDPSQRDDGNVAQVPPPVTPEFVRELQQTLRAQGQQPGPVDGIWGPRTHQALQQYQQEQAVGSSGQLDTETIAALDLQERAAQQQRAEAPSGQQPQASAPAEQQEEQQAALE